MRKLIAALIVTASTTVMLPAMAAEVAVLDWRAALMNTESAQASLDDLENQIGDKQREAEALGGELQELQRRLQEDAEMLPESQREDLISEFEQKGNRFESLRQEVVQAQQRSEQAFLQRAEGRLEQAVDQVITRHEIEVLVEPQGVLHSSRDLPNLTEEVTEAFNALD